VANDGPTQQRSLHLITDGVSPKQFSYAARHHRTTLTCHSNEPAPEVQKRKKQTTHICRGAWGQRARCSSRTAKPDQHPRYCRPASPNHRHSWSPTECTAAALCLSSISHSINPTYGLSLPGLCPQISRTKRPERLHPSPVPNHASKSEGQARA
jgi:hypothetical protein